ncbi:a471b0b9-df80-4d84-a350-546e9fef7690-CDS [Sclerotinia trifoliorum]|uniref:A471b0b9-df80-4d84-a350-546e9fef7690-CDS n=1 Tax=Sclerotinia trifoliorum TaxID=28548 RepID=A0A8H2VUW8_9HELO|nr:a471b0b9-df80-4d84-a350-546e9fef7690-CDS [Sclerotinia trifoliorum]
MDKKNASVTNCNLPPVLPKPRSSIEAHESLLWLEKARCLQIIIAYNEDKTQEETALYMAILLDRISEYGPWADKLDFLIHPRIVRCWESPNIYAQHIRQTMALVNRINRSFTVLTYVNVRLEIDYANFQQMKLAACFIALKVYWKLSYYVDGIFNLNEIGAHSHLMRRLCSVYDRDCKV